MSTPSATKVSFPIYLLAMEGANPRRDIAMGRVTEQFGKEPILVDGINALGVEVVGPRFWPVERGEWTKGRPDRLSLGQKACATGHLTILTRFLQSGEECCLIVEDDAEFLHDAFGFECVLYDVKHHDPQWSWIHCGGRQCKAVEGPKMAKPPIFGSRSLPWRTTNVAEVEECGWNTCCYFISRRGACSILSRATPLTCVYDAYTRYAGPGDHLYNTAYDLYQQDPRMKSLIGASMNAVSAPNLADPCLQGMEAQHDLLHATTP